MRPEEYSEFDLCGLQDLVSSGDCSTEEIHESAVAALRQADERYACMVEVCEDALQRSQASARDLAFSGLPIVLKDAGAHGANAVQEAGSRLFAGIPAEIETFSARRLREAGLISLGRTTTSELTYGFSAEPSWGRPTVNPWDTGKTAGGSSSGSAVAVASGAIPVAHGTDGGGSLRVPAAWCGVMALKPSRGAISWGPGLSEVLFGMATEGVISRTVRDTAALLDVLCGAEPGDPICIARPDQSYAHSHRLPLGSLRVGVVTDRIAGGLPVAADILGIVEAATKTLDEAGCDVDRVDLALNGETLIHSITDVWCSQLSLMVAGVVEATGRNPRDNLDPALYQSFEHGLSVSAAQLWLAQLAFNEASRTIGALFESLDLLVLPTANVTAPELGVLSPNREDADAYAWTARNFAPATFTAPFNIAGLPALSLPLGVGENGMPIGVQFVAKHGQDDLLLRVASFFEAAGLFIQAQS